MVFKSLPTRRCRVFAIVDVDAFLVGISQSCTLSAKSAHASRCGRGPQPTHRLRPQTPRTRRGRRRPYRCLWPNRWSNRRPFTRRNPQQNLNRRSRCSRHGRPRCSTAGPLGNIVLHIVGFRLLAMCANRRLVRAVALARLVMRPCMRIRNLALFLLEKQTHNQTTNAIISNIASHRAQYHLNTNQIWEAYPTQLLTRTSYYVGVRRIGLRCTPTRLGRTLLGQWELCTCKQDCF